MLIFRRNRVKLALVKSESICIFVKVKVYVKWKVCIMSSAQVFSQPKNLKVFLTGFFSPLHC